LSRYSDGSVTNNMQTCCTSYKRKTSKREEYPLFQQKNTTISDYSHVIAKAARMMKTKVHNLIQMYHNERTVELYILKNTQFNIEVTGNIVIEKS
jgi:hypothetical protein